ncbi:TadE family protein [Streptomyces sp. NPDC059009]|uniref:TadE family protein n=1 Tax=Streptomyces sp. NPDC059009 TaxID=3346694 RepID=UPI00367C3105
MTTPAWRQRVRGTRGRGDGGTVTAEMVFVLPLLFTIVLLIAQYALWAHATHIAQATAAHSLAAARVEEGTEQDGQREAQRVLDQLGRSALRGPRVEVERGADRASVRVAGSASAVLPFLHLSVHAQADGPVEVFRPGQGGTP